MSIPTEHIDAIITHATEPHTDPQLLKLDIFWLISHCAYLQGMVDELDKFVTSMVEKAKTDEQVSDVQTLRRALQLESGHSSLLLWQLRERDAEIEALNKSNSEPYVVRISRREFMELPIETRKAVMARQADAYVEP